jgi:hypothetical protein
MSNNPEERNRDSRKSEENGLTQETQPEPIDKQDPTNPVQVQGDSTGKAKASADVGGGDAAATGAAGR